MKCPNCGHDLSKPFDYNVQLFKLLDAIEPETKKKIEFVTNYIMREIPGENSSKKYYTFLKDIENIPYNIIIEGLSKYANGGYAKDGKGFAYLGYIIKSWYKQRDKVIDNQRKIYGESPPVRKLE